MGGVEVPQVPSGVGVEKGIPLPVGGRVWGPRKFFVFFVEKSIF